MKLIKAIIEPQMAERAVGALSGVKGVHYVALSDITCMNEHHRSHNPDNNKNLELMVPDELVEQILEIIESKARTGRVGDGHIFVIDIQKTICIRSGDCDDS